MEFLVSITGVASNVTTVLTAILVAALAVAVVMLIWRRLAARRSGTLVVTQLAAGANDASGFGAAATEALKVRLEELRSEDVVRVDLATAASGELALPAAVTAQLPQASLVDAVLSLIDLLLPPNEWRLTGYLEPAVDGQLAISLTLMDRGRRVTQAASLRESDFSPGDFEPRPADPPEVVSARQEPGPVDYDRYARLITPAAVWLYYTTRELAGRDEPLALRVLPGGAVEAPAPFGVRDWQSYALTAAGAELQAADDPKGARTLYARALGLEPKNRMALFNLGVLDIRDGKRTDRGERLIQRGRARFVRVRELSEAAAGAANATAATGKTVHIKHDGLWCRATYNLALADILLGEEANLDEANEATSDLVERLTAIQRPKQSILGEEDPDTYRRAMREFAAELEPQVLILAAGLLHFHPDARLRRVLAACIGRAAGGALADAVITRARGLGLSYRGHYNLAAYYARRGDDAPHDSEDQAKLFCLALDELDACFEAATNDLKTWARHDPSFTGLRAYHDPEGVVDRLFPREERRRRRPAVRR